MNNYLNNYNFFKNYSQTQKNNYQQLVDNVKKQYNQEMYNTHLFNPYQGFIRGNMFQNLYNQYKVTVPYEIKPLNEQAELLTYIDSLSFACIDLNLYLDVNPNDKSALDLFNQYKIKKKELLEDYQNRFGPLFLGSDSLNNYPWAWNDKPWPWES